MKKNAKLAVLAGAALLVGVTAAAQEASSTTDETTRTTTTTTTIRTTTAPAADRNTEVRTSTATRRYEYEREYDGFVTFPVKETITEEHQIEYGDPEPVQPNDYFGGQLTVTNKVGSKIIQVVDGAGAKKLQPRSDGYGAEFAGIDDTFTVEYTAPRLNFKLAPTVSLREAYENLWRDAWYTQLKTNPGYSSETGTASASTGANSTDTWYGLNADDVGFVWSGMDWFVEVYPFRIAALEFHHDFYTPGSYLPVIDANVASGNLGSNGFGVLLTPIEGLRISATLPISFEVFSKANYVNAEYEDYTEWVANGSAYWTTKFGNPFANFKFTSNFGLDYQFRNLFTVGLTLQDILNSSNRAIGLHFSLTAIKNMFANLGVTLNYAGGNPLTFDYFAIPLTVGNTLDINAAFGLALGRFDFGADVVFGIGFDLGDIQAGSSDYLAYIGLKGTYDVIPDTFNAGARLFIGIPDGGDLAFGINPSVTYTTGRHKFEAGFVYEFVDPFGGWNFFTFPVSWTFTF